MKAHWMFPSHGCERWTVGKGLCAVNPISAGPAHRDWLHLPHCISGARACACLFFPILHFALLFLLALQLCLFLEPSSYILQAALCLLELRTKYNLCYRQRHPYMSAPFQCVCKCHCSLQTRDGYKCCFHFMGVHFKMETVTVDTDGRVQEEISSYHRQLSCVVSCVQKAQSPNHRWDRALFSI